jgi:NAD(P)-dependent dehydrogenase (short-subunit alcohol dehydrogenase family)/catechol 2,3-dioxygenase-like lactoylglutathione lyase family enzyme
MSVRDLRRTHAWYTRVFGFLPAGGTNAFKGFLAEKVQGVPGAASTCWWLMDSKVWFQLELFEFYRPETRPLPEDWRLCDIGYGMVGLVVDDFDRVLAALQDTGTATLTAPRGEPGERRVCVRDPEGVLLEIMEAEPLPATPVQKARPDVPVTVRSLTLSVADLAQSRRFFCDVLELTPIEGEKLHEPGHGELWGLPGAEREELLLDANGVVVEIVQYRDPPGKPPPADYRISDQGLLNIALGYRTRREFNRIYSKCREAGIEGNWRPLKLGAWSVVYVNDAQGFSVELLHVAPWYDKPMGFKPAPPPRLKRRRGAQAWRTAIITGGGSGIGRELARRLLAEGTAVAVIDRNTDAPVREALQTGGPGSVSFHTADVTDRAQLNTAVADAVAEIGPPDLVVNSAGIQNAKPFEELSADDFETVVKVNLFGSRNLAAAALPHMQRGSQLALIASLAGLVPSHSYTAYNSSKYAVVGLAGALRLECIESGIEVSVICPPEVNTPMVVEERKELPPVAAKLKNTAGTLEVGPACDAILAGLRRGNFMIVPGWRARAVAAIGRWFPNLMRRISERIVLATVGARDRSSS